jgi:hypothetical protein
MIMPRAVFYGHEHAPNPEDLALACPLSSLRLLHLAQNQPYGLHRDDHRWSYRIVIYYKDSTSPSRASAIEKTLFPDQALMKREESRRWDLTEDHWDLPIRQTDPNASE